jgi:ceramide glucosyltransferase
MTPSVFAAELFCATAIFFHVGSIVVMIGRSRGRIRPAPARGEARSVTVIRPVHGLHFGIEETLGSSLELDYPECEVMFCAAGAEDPAVPVVRRLLAAHPGVKARLLLGEDLISENPKLNNCFKGWNAAATEWVVMVDSNVLMPADYVQRMLARWTVKTGLVSAPPIASRPEGFWAHVECSLLNGFQAPAQYFGDALGIGFAMGKNMMWRRRDLEAAGGMKALASAGADDVAATKIVRAAGRRVVLVDGPFEQPIGRRTFAEVWRRQARWARIRRCGFLEVFLPEVLNGLFPPLIAVAWLAHAGVLPFVPGAAALTALWYGAETALSLRAGWPFSPLLPIHGLVRDLLMPFLWVYGFSGEDIVWHGKTMSLVQSGGRPEPDSDPA